MIRVVHRQPLEPVRVEADRVAARLLAPSPIRLSRRNTTFLSVVRIVDGGPPVGDGAGASGMLGPEDADGERADDRLDPIARQRRKCGVTLLRRRLRERGPQLVGQRRAKRLHHHRRGGTPFGAFFRFPTSVWSRRPGFWFNCTLVGAAFFDDAFFFAASTAGCSAKSSLRGQRPAAGSRRGRGAGGSAGGGRPPPLRTRDHRQRRTQEEQPRDDCPFERAVVIIPGRSP